MILLITPQQVIDKTPFNGNIDYDKLIPCIEDAQVTDLEPILGQVLFDKILDDYEAETLSELYLDLYNKFIVDYLIRASAKNYFLIGAYQIANGGIYKHSAENAETISKEEVDYLMVQQRSKMEVYGTRMKRWLSYNSIPEYLKHSEIINAKPQNVTSWWFGGRSNCVEQIDTWKNE
jgi:hypothetical protein